MIVRGGTGFRAAVSQFVLRNWLAIAAVVAVDMFAWLVDDWMPDLENSAVSAGAVGFLATIVGIFLAFRFNEAYARWWEARTLWGAMVNSSRTFARQVTTLLTAERLGTIPDDAEAAKLHRELVYRHLAYVHALRLTLRRQPVESELSPYLEPAELESVTAAASPTTRLLQHQGHRIAELTGNTVDDQLLRQHLDDTLTALTDAQGGMERIKNTAFPDRVIAVSWSFVWILAVAIPLVFGDAHATFYLLELATIVILVLSLFLVKQIGQELADPFENRANDIPMTALCRTIEIDLRQMLGEADVPEPLKPVDGVLM